MSRMTDDEPDDGSSTLVRSGKTAMTFTEMATFVRELATRPAARFLEDLPGLMALPEGQYGLVTMVLRKKVRPEGTERPALVVRLKELQAAADDATVRARCKLFLARPDLG
jgi:hypothetical protein